MCSLWRRHVPQCSEHMLHVRTARGRLGEAALNEGGHSCPLDLRHLLVLLSSGISGGLVENHFDQQHSKAEHVHLGGVVIREPGLGSRVNWITRTNRCSPAPEVG